MNNKNAIEVIKFLKTTLYKADYDEILMIKCSNEAIVLVHIVYV